MVLEECMKCFSKCLGVAIIICGRFDSELVCRSRFLLLIIILYLRDILMLKIVNCLVI